MRDGGLKLGGKVGVIGRGVVVFGKVEWDVGNSFDFVEGIDWGRLGVEKGDVFEDGESDVLVMFKIVRS